VQSKIKAKKVGSVQICEVFGDFQGAFARRSAAALGQLAKSGATPARSLLMNISKIGNIDENALQSLVDLNKSFVKKAVISSDPAVKQAVAAKQIDAFTNVEQAAAFFQRELAELADGGAEDERREFVRLDTILPAYFKAKDDPAGAEYFAVVTNLSEGGFFAEFVQSTAEEEALKKFNPMELKLMSVRLKFQDGTEVAGDAKIIHARQGEGGVGMEFYGLDPQAREKLRDWLAQHLARPK